MFLCLLIDELCTKEESNETGWFFNCFDQSIIRKVIPRLIKTFTPYVKEKRFTLFFLLNHCQYLFIEKRLYRYPKQTATDSWGIWSESKNEWITFADWLRLFLS